MSKYQRQRPILGTQHGPRLCSPHLQRPLLQHGSALPAQTQLCQTHVCKLWMTPTVLRAFPTALLWLRTSARQRGLFRCLSGLPTLPAGLPAGPINEWAAFRRPSNGTSLVVNSDMDLQPTYGMLTPKPGLPTLGPGAEVEGASLVTIQPTSKMFAF